MSNLPAIWTVYDSPTDYPGRFVARLFTGDGDGYVPTASIIIADSLSALRHTLLAELHLTCLARHEDDDPKIVEIWL